MPSAQRRLGAWPSFAFRPLLEGLEQETAFALAHYPPAYAAFKLRDHEVDISFLSPIDYAKDSSTLVIVPEVGLWSQTGGNAVTVHFRTDLQETAAVGGRPGQRDREQSRGTVS